MKKVYGWMHQLLPVSLKKSLGQSTWLKPLRDRILRNEGHFKTEFVDIKKDDPKVSFRFFASLKYALNAKNKGVESTLLKQSLKLLSHPENNLVVLDVGSNFGYLSMVWAQTLCQNGTVHAFETNPDVCQAFKQAISYNKFTNIVLHQKAVGNKNEWVNMYHLDTSSNVNQLGTSKESFSIQMLTLDVFMESEKMTRCDLMKIDVDGIEHDILLGSVNLIKKYHPIVIVETNNNQRIPEFFVNLGYALFDLDLNPYTQGTMPLPDNIYCLPPK